MNLGTIMSAATCRAFEFKMNGKWSVIDYLSINVLANLFLRKILLQLSVVIVFVLFRFTLLFLIESLLKEVKVGFSPSIFIYW